MPTQTNQQYQMLPSGVAVQQPNQNLVSNQLQTAQGNLPLLVCVI